MPRQKTYYLRSILLSLMASTAISYPGEAAELSGTALKVSTNANVSGEGGTRVLRAPGDVFQGDVISTDFSGEAQIEFLDDTRFVIGPNSRVKIDEFVFNPDKTAKALGVAALKGTFRFISGTSPHDAYSIRTPTATIGVRGTAIDFSVTGIRTTILWQQGEGTVCVVPRVGGNFPLATECQDVTVGDLISAPAGGGFGVVDATGVASLKYANSEAGLGDGFKLGGRFPPSPPPRFQQRPGPY